MTRRTLVATVVVAGVAVVAGLQLAPVVPPGGILLLSALWYGALAVLLWSAWLILSHWLGHGGALLVVLLGAATPILLTALPVPPALAVALPCPRNWGFLPTWLLRSSPAGSVRFEFHGVKGKLCYGRPAARERRMIGGSRVPFGQLWRTGANEPTTLISTGVLEVAGVAVPPGRSSLYSIPGPETWELILNAATRQWGIESEYSAAIRARELGRAILPSGNGDYVERLTFFFEPEANGDSDRAELILAWETTRVHIPVRSASR